MMILQLGLVFIIAAGLAAMISSQSRSSYLQYGGLAPAGGVGLGILLLIPQGWLDWEQAVAFLLSGVVLVLTGAFSKSRIAAGVAAVSAAIIGLSFLWLIPSYGRIPPLPLPSGQWQWGWAGFAVMAVILTGLAWVGQGLAQNEGKAALMGIVLTLPLAVLAYLQGAYCHGWLIAAYAAACCGFYVYNRAPAALYPGSGGAMWLSFTPALLAALSADTIGLHIWLPALGFYALLAWKLSRSDQKKA